jgi:hypothetical protein
MNFVKLEINKDTLVVLFLGRKKEIEKVPERKYRGIIASSRWFWIDSSRKDKINMEKTNM